MSPVQARTPEEYKTLDDPVCPGCSGHGVVGSGSGATTCGACQGDGRAIDLAGVVRRREALDAQHDLPRGESDARHAKLDEIEAKIRAGLPNRH